MKVRRREEVWRIECEYSTTSWSREENQELEGKVD